MKNNRIGRFLTGFAMLLVLVNTGYTLSYFTDQESVTNVFTVGKIDVALSEPAWIQQENILPQQEISLNPTITNEGINEAFVFVQVDVPCVDVVVASKDGARQEMADTELFNWSVKEGWIQVGETQKNEEKNIHTYTYAYGNEKEMENLEKEEAVTVFETITFANVIEGQGLEGEQLQIDIRTYAIQTENLSNTENEELEEVQLSPKEVWQILHEQAGISSVQDEPAEEII